MAKSNGFISTLNQMIDFLKKLFAINVKYDPLIDGMYAHHYINEEVRQKIAQDYKKKFTPVVTPLTNPEQYDPLNPPEGWMYDPYYEIWIKKDSY